MKITIDLDKYEATNPDAPIERGFIGEILMLLMDVSVTEIVIKRAKIE